MAKELNFNTAKKRYLRVTLADEKNTVLLVGTPTKKVLGELFDVQDRLTSVEDEEVSMDLLDDLYSVCTAVLNHNKGGVKITREELEDILDLDDIILLFTAYMQFIGEETDKKN